MLPSLECINLSDNQIADEGCAALASALRGGALPALNGLDLWGNPASEQAQEAACDVLNARSGREGDGEEEGEEEGAEEGEEEGGGRTKS